MTKISIGKSQAYLMILVVTIGTVFFPVAGVVVPLAGTSGWVAVLLAFVIALPWCAMSAYLAGTGPPGDWGKAVFAWLGPIAGRIFLLYFAFVWLWLGGLLLGQTGFVVHDMAMPRTPPAVLNFALLLLVVLVDYKGLEVFVRTIEALAWLSIIGIFSFVVVVVPLIDLDNLRPIIDAAPALIAHATLLSLPWAMEGVLFALFIGVFLRQRSGMGGIFALAVEGAGVILALMTVFTLGVLGRGVTTSYLYPAAILAQTARPGFFLEGIEVLLYPLWIVASYIKVGASFIMVSLSLMGVWKGFRQPYRAILLGVAFLVIATAPPNISALVASIARVANSFFMSFYLILPLLALWVRLRRQEE